MRSFGEEHLIDHALVLAVLFLVLGTVGVADAIVVFRADSFALALIVIGAHAGAPIVKLLLDLAELVVGLRLVVILFLFLIVVRLLGVALLDFHDLDVGVHLGGALALLDCDPDEAIVAPAGAPGVLDDPVGDALVLQASCVVFLAAVPPLIDFAVRWSRLRLGLGARLWRGFVIAAIAAIATTAKVVSDDSNSVVKASAAVVLSDNTGAKAAPSARADSDIEWLLCSSLLHLVDGGHRLPHAYFANGLLLVVHVAILFLVGHVWVV